MEMFSVLGYSPHETSKDVVRAGVSTLSVSPILIAYGLIAKSISVPVKVRAKGELVV